MNLIEIPPLNLLSRLLSAVKLDPTLRNIGSYSVDDRSTGSLGTLRPCFITDTTTNAVALFRQVRVEENTLESEDSFKQELIATKLHANLSQVMKNYSVYILILSRVYFQSLYYVQK
jgi:hypothetical protein